MLQVAALIAFAFIVLVILVDNNLLKYRPVYEEAEIDLAAVEAKCAHLSDDPNDDHSAFGKMWPQAKVSPQQDCFNRETQPRVVGEEFVGVNSRVLTFVLIWFVLAFAVPFAVVRVPTWLLEGWREDR